MYAAVNKELCDKMMAELEGMLSTQFGMKNTPINVEKHKELPPDSKVPLIVICINASRLGTDVNQAIHKIDRKYHIVQLQEISNRVTLIFSISVVIKKIYFDFDFQ